MNGIKFLLMLPLIVLAIGCDKDTTKNVSRETAVQSAINELLNAHFVPRISEGKYSELYSWRFGLDLGVLGDDEIDLDLDWQSADKDFYRSHSHFKYCFGADSTITNIFALVGEGTIFESEFNFSRDELPPCVIVLVEVGNSGTHWMQPGDFDVAKIPKKIVNLNTSKNEETPVISSDDANGFFVAFADGEVWKLSYDVEFEKLEQFFRIATAKEVDRDRVLGRWRLN